MSKPESPIDEIHNLMIEKHLDYQLSLVNRRWQYFATYLLVNGLLFNVWKDIGTSERVLATLLSAGSIVIAMMFLQLISLADKRIEKSQIYLLKVKANVFDFPLDGKFHLQSETVILNFAFIAIATGWFYLLYVTDYITGIVITATFIINLFSLRWQTTKISGLQ